MTDRFDVFLSHNSKEKPAVREITGKLREAGLTCWLDEEQLIPGVRWQGGLADGLQRSATCAIFIGRDNLGNWESEELDVAQNRAANQRDYRITPVLLPGLTDPFDTSLLPPFLQSRTWVDFRSGLDDQRALRRLICAIRGIPPGPDDGGRQSYLESATGITPYLGLDTFDEKSADLFFGRDADVQRLIEKLKASNFLAVIGASGSGKSSLVRAGLIPALRTNTLPESGEWAIMILRPGAHPITELALKLLELPGQSRSTDSLSRLENGLRQNDRTLHQEARLHITSLGLTPEQDLRRRIVIVVDQFEELFTLCMDEAERRSFLNNLLHASSALDSRCVVILTLRADFYHKCLPFEGLAPRMANHQYGVGPMSDENLKQAIEGPASLMGVRVEPELLQEMIDEVRNQPGSLPLLEYTLLEVWKRRRDQTMTLRDYHASGGVKEALARRAEDIYAGLKAEQQEIVRRIMLRLTQPGQGTEDTRRRASLSELVAQKENHQQVEAVVSQFTSARLLTTNLGDQEGIVDVSHEALIRGWPRLREWVDEDRAGLQIQHRLSEATREWIKGNRDKELLYRGNRLREALDWSQKRTGSLSVEEQEFITLSEKEQKKDKRRRKVVISVIAAASILLISIFTIFGIGMYSIYQENNEKNRVIDLMEKDFVRIPSGEFEMGSLQGRKYERPPRRVRIRSFEMGKFEVTQKQWWAVMDNSPSAFSGDDRPVEFITWNEVQDFCQRLSQKTGKTYRLPTEAEWEYAARGGTLTAFSFGDDENKLEEYGWYAANSGTSTHAVGTKLPNPFGLFDMHGNVWEWVEDSWHDNYEGAPSDGTAWRDSDGAALRVIRGGSWLDNAVACRSAFRYGDEPGNRRDNLGFRLSRTLP
jgi:formylglycine-generating enzyme required for sulfatase activity